MATKVEELIVQITAELDKARSDVKKFESQLEKLTGEKQTVKLTAEVEGKRDVEQFIKSLDKLSTDSKTVVLGIEAARAEGQLDDIRLHMRELASTGVEIPVELAAGAAGIEGDLERIEGEIKSINSTGVNIDTSRARTGIDDIGRSANSSKSVLANLVGNSVQDLGALGGIAGSAGVAIGQMGEYMVDASASGDKLGDVVRNFGKVALPIAAIAGGIATVTDAMRSNSDTAERSAESVQRWEEALSGSGSAIDKWTSQMEDQGKVILDNVRNYDTVTNILTKIPPISFFDEETKDISPILQRAAVSTTMIAEAAFKRGEAETKLRAAVEATNLSDEDKSDILTYLNNQIEDVTTAEENRAKVEELTAQSSTSMAEGIREFVEAADPVKAMPEDFALVSEAIERVNRGLPVTAEQTAALNRIVAETGLEAEQVYALAAQGEDKLAKARERAFGLQKKNADQMRDAVAEAAELERTRTEAVREGTEAMLDAAQASEAFASALDRINQASELDFALMAFDTVNSFDDVKESIKAAAEEGQNWATMDLSPESVEELRGISPEFQAITESVAGMRGAIDTELQAAFDTGGIDAYSEKADFFANEILAQFPAMFQEMGASEEEAAALTNQLLDELNLLPADKEIMIKLTREEEARNALEEFGSFIDTLPEEKRIAIRTAIAQGDIEGALAILNEQLIQKGYAPIILPIDLGEVPPPPEPPVIPPAVIPTLFGDPSIPFTPPPIAATVLETAYGPLPVAPEVPPVAVDIEGNPQPVEEAISDVTDAEHSTTVVAEPDIGRADAALATLARDRRMTVIAGSDTAAANGALATAARDRRMTIIASASTGSAESALASLTRTRSVTIVPRVAPTTVLVRVDGGGP